MNQSIRHEQIYNTPLEFCNDKEDRKESKDFKIIIHSRIYFFLKNIIILNNTDTHTVDSSKQKNGRPRFHVNNTLSLSFKRPTKFEIRHYLYKSRLQKTICLNKFWRLKMIFSSPTASNPPPTPHLYFTNSTSTPFFARSQQPSKRTKNELGHRTRRLVTSVERRLQSRDRPPSSHSK